MKSRIAVSILSLSLAVLSLLLGGCYGKEPVPEDLSGGCETSFMDNDGGFFSENSLR